MTTNIQKKFVYVDQESVYIQHCKDIVFPDKLQSRQKEQTEIISKCANKGIRASAIAANIKVPIYSKSFENDAEVIKERKEMIDSYKGATWRKKERINTLRGYDKKEVEIYDTQKKFNTLAVNTVVNQRGKELDAKFMTKNIDNICIYLNQLFNNKQIDIQQYGILTFLDELLTAEIKFDCSRKTKLVLPGVLKKMEKELTDQCVILKNIFNSVHGYFKQKKKTPKDKEFKQEFIKQCKILLTEKKKIMKGINNNKKHKMDDNNNNNNNSFRPIKRRKYNDTMHSVLEGNNNNNNIHSITSSLPSLSTNNYSLNSTLRPLFDNEITANNVSPMSCDTVSTSLQLLPKGIKLKMTDYFIYIPKLNTLQLSSNIYFNDTVKNMDSNRSYLTGIYTIDCIKDMNASWYQWTFKVKSSNAFFYGIGLNTESNSIRNVLCYGWASYYNKGHLFVSPSKNKSHHQIFENNDLITMILDVKHKTLKYAKNCQYTDIVINDINPSYQYKMAVLMEGRGEIQLLHFQKLYY